jgi:hypothetical protein
MLSQRENVNCFYMYNLCWSYGEMILSHPEHTRKWFHRWLSILGNDFIADWAYAEMFKIRISAESNTIFKNLVLQALGTIRIRFLQKSVLKNLKSFNTLCTLQFHKCTLFYNFRWLTRVLRKRTAEFQCSGFLILPFLNSIHIFSGTFRTKWQCVLLQKIHFAKHSQIMKLISLVEI